MTGLGFGAGMPTGPFSFAAPVFPCDPCEGFAGLGFAWGDGETCPGLEAAGLPFAEGAPCAPCGCGFTWGSF